MPLSTSVVANRSLFSTYSSRIVSRSTARTSRRGSAAASATTATARAWYPLRDAGHDSGTVRRRLVPRRTTARRPRLGRRSPRSRSDGPGASRSRRSCVRPTASAGETDDERWLARAREAAARRPARAPHALDEPDARASDRRRATRASGSLREGAWLARARASAPTLFCGGGWYTDRGVAAACAALGYADCTPRAARPAYLAADARVGRARTPARAPTRGRRRLVAAADAPTGGRRSARGARAGGCPTRVHVVLPRHRPRRPPAAARRRGRAAAPRRRRRVARTLDDEARRPSRDAARASSGTTVARGGAGREAVVRSARADRGAPDTARGAAADRRATTSRRRTSAARPSTCFARRPWRGLVRRARERRRARRCSTWPGSRSAIYLALVLRSVVYGDRSTGRCSGTPGRASGSRSSPRSPCSSSSRRGSTRRASAVPGRAASSGSLVLVALIVLAFGLGTDYEFTTTGLIPTAVVTCSLAIGLLRAAYESISLELLKVAGVRRRRRARRRGRAARRPRTGSCAPSRGGIGIDVVGGISRGRGAGPRVARSRDRRRRRGARARATGRADPRRGRTSTRRPCSTSSSSRTGAA